MSGTDFARKLSGRIIELRTRYAGARGKSAFARKLGLSPSTYDYYEHERMPPADVLVAMADVTGADLGWLLTGREPQPLRAEEHPVIARAAQMLARQPDSAPALAAFVELLDQAAGQFPRQIGPHAANATPATGAPAMPAATAAVLADPAPTPIVRRGWIPILGRSAAGVPHFWRDVNDDPAGITLLMDLVKRMQTHQPRHVVAGAARSNGPERRAVQIVTLDSPEPPGTAEFLVSEAVAGACHAPFAVRIDGTSMEPDICHGDIVVLSPSRAAEPGKAAVIQLRDQIGVTCKIYDPRGDQVDLVPINGQFSPTTHPADEIVWALCVVARVQPD